MVPRLTDDRRRSLVRRAATEFAEQGYERASLNRIIGDLRMSKSSFYYALKSKHDLYVLCVADLSAEIMGSATIPDSSEFRQAFWPTVHRMIDELAAALARDPAYRDLGRMLYLPDAPADASIPDPLAAVRDWLAQTLQVGREVGAIADDLPADLQLAATFALLQAFDRWSVTVHPRPDGERRLLAAQLAALERFLRPGRSAVPTP